MRTLVRARPVAVVVGFMLVLASCKGCEKKASVPPSAYVAKDAEAVIELPDIGFFAKKPDLLSKMLAGIATPEQQVQLFAEIQRGLGFDPLSETGLTAAGLPKTGPAAIQMIDRGRQGLVIVPVADQKLFGAAVKQYAGSRSAIQKDEVKKQGQHDVHVLSTTFGPEEMVVVAWMVHRGMGLVGIGRSAVELVAAAADRKPEQSVLQDPEYKALTKELGAKGFLQFYVPGASRVAEMLTQNLPAGSPKPNEALVKEIASVGWSLSLESRRVKVEGRARFGDKGREMLGRMWKAPGTMPPGVRALRQEDTVLFATAVGDFAALLAEAAPPGSAMAADLDRTWTRLRTDTGVDFQKELLPKLSGHVALAAGFGELDQFATIRDVLRNPAGLIWTDFAFGLKEQEAVAAMGLVGEKIDPLLGQRGFARQTRKVGEIEATRIVGKEKPDFLLVEMFANGNALSLVNHAGRMEKVIEQTKKPEPDPLEGKPGIYLELQFAPVMVALRQVDLDRVIGSGPQAMIVKAVVTKVVLALSQLDVIEAQLVRVDDGLGFEATLNLLEGARKTP